MIRKARISDAANITNLILSLSHHYLKPGAPLPEWFLSSISVENIMTRLENTLYSHFVYEIDLNLQGYIALQNNDTLYHLFVSEAHQRQGIAAALFRHSRSILNAPIIRLRSSIMAIPLYQQLGFATIGPIQEKDGILFQPMELKNIHPAIHL